MRLLQTISTEFAAQHGYLFPWVPVALGVGIGGYFSLPAEPAREVWIVIVCVTCLALILARFVSAGLAPVLLLSALVLAGAQLAGLRAHHVAETKLSYRHYGPVEGRIVGIDRSGSDAVRLTLDRARLRDMSPLRTPARVRISLHGTQGFFVPEPGQVIILTAHLSPPGGPVEPGGFDFQRMAWFQRLGAVGYTRTPALLLRDAAPGGFTLRLYRFRMALSQAVQEALPGRAGGFASAITTGDRSGMDRDTLEALRAANLAHLLAISGLHMGLLTGFVFAALRLGMAVSPGIALRLPMKKIAAICALGAGAGYLALSGGNVATERAFIMVAVMFGAVLSDRRAITLRAVAVAATIVLILRPETLYGPGFQMSFAATTALVATFGWLRDAELTPLSLPKPLKVLAGVALSSAVAGAATAPIAAAHFNQVPHFGLIANVVSVPLMGAVIIPGAVLAAILSPFGLHWIGLKLMEAPINWILAVAETVAAWPNALSFVIAPQTAVLPMIALGGPWVVIWQGRLRIVGAPVVLGALALWSTAPRPDLLVSDTGGLIGLATEEGRLLSKSRGESFAAMNWLENDGDPAPQEVAAGRAGWSEAGRSRRLRLGDASILHATGKGAGTEALRRCRNFQLVIVNIRADETRTDCNVIDTDFLRVHGAVAIDVGDKGLEVTTARDLSGRRLWSQ